MGSILVGERAWLIAYDIADPRRLGRVFRLLKGVAVPVQYSVFVGWFRDRELARLRGDLAARIENTADDVRLYHLPSRLEIDSLGRRWLGEELVLGHRGGGVPAWDAMHVASPQGLI